MILPPCSRQNDSIPQHLSRHKEVTPKGRPLVIGYSCLPLLSPPGAAELAPLKQSSPFFRFLARFRQPDKGGHVFDLRNRYLRGRVALHYMSEMLRYRSVWQTCVIPNACEESHIYLFFGWNSSFHSEWQRFRGLSPLVIPSEAGRPTRNLRLFIDWDSSLRLCFVQNDISVISNESERSLTIRDSSRQGLSEWHTARIAVLYLRFFDAVRLTCILRNSFLRSPERQ